MLLAVGCAFVVAAVGCFYDRFCITIALAFVFAVAVAFDVCVAVAVAYMPLCFLCVCLCGCLSAWFVCSCVMPLLVYLLLHLCFTRVFASAFAFVCCS